MIAPVFYRNSIYSYVRCKMSIGFLQQIPLFQGLNRDELEEILSLIKVKTYQAQDIIFRQGEMGDAAMIVQSGTIEIFVFDGQQSHVITRFEKGAVFGELSLIDHLKRSAGARALTSTELLLLDQASFDQLRKAQKSGAYKILKALANELCHRIRESNEQIEDLLKGESQSFIPIITDARRVNREEDSSLFSKLFSFFR
jgi:CRP/FNR family cyclic AMP-dependent transcriptional regulator